MTTATMQKVPAKEIEVKTEQIRILTGVNPQTNLQPRRDLAGCRLKMPNAAPVYVINPEGYRQWIPDPSTYNNLFANWNEIYVYLDADKIALAPPLSVGAVLAKSSNNTAVYLISNGVKRWIINPPIFDKFDFAWDQILVLPPVVVDAIPTGPNWD